MAFALAAAAIGGSAVAGIAGAEISSSATKDAAQTQADAANNATNVQNQEFQQVQQNQAPWRLAGEQALPQIQGMAGKTPNFSMQDFYANQDPAYQFDLQQGQQALERSAAARGGLMSGGTLKDLTTYAQGQASNEYGNAYNRYMNNQNTAFNRLASVAGLGQTANGQINEAGMNNANQIGNNITGAANGRAAAQIAGGNTWGNTLSSIGSSGSNSLMGFQQIQNQKQLLNGLYPQTSNTGSLGVDSGEMSGPAWWND